MPHQEVSGSSNKHPRYDEGLHTWGNVAPIDQRVIDGIHATPIGPEDERTYNEGRPKNKFSVHSSSPNAFAAVLRRNGV